MTSRTPGGRFLLSKCSLVLRADFGLPETGTCSTAVEPNSTENKQQKDPQKRGMGSGTQASQRITTKQMFRARDTKLHYSNRNEPQLTHACLSTQVIQPSWEKVSYSTLTAVWKFIQMPLLSKGLDSKGIGSKRFIAFSPLFLWVCRPRSYSVQAYREQR